MARLGANPYDRDERFLYLHDNGLLRGQWAQLAIVARATASRLLVFAGSGRGADFAQCSVAASPRKTNFKLTHYRLDLRGPRANARAKKRLCALHRKPFSAAMGRLQQHVVRRLWVAMPFELAHRTSALASYRPETAIPLSTSPFISSAAAPRSSLGQRWPGGEGLWDIQSMIRPLKRGGRGMRSAPVSPCPKNGTIAASGARNRAFCSRPVLSISRAGSGPSPSLQRAPRGRRRPDPLEPSVRVACGRPVRSRHPACACHGGGDGSDCGHGYLLLATPVLVLLAEPAPIAFNLWMRTDGDAPWGRREKADVRAVLPLSLSAFLVWLACGLTMAFGREALGLETGAQNPRDCRSCVRRAPLSPLFHVFPERYSVRRRCCLLHRVHHRPGRRARRPGVREEL